MQLFQSTTRQIFHATQKSSLNALEILISAAFFLIGLSVFSHFEVVAFEALAILYLFSTNIPAFALGIVFFRRNRNLIPVRLRIYRSCRQQIVSFGIKVFVVQIASLATGSMIRVLILQVLGPSAVTQYELGNKLFGIVIILQSLVTVPLWSATTNAYAQGDYQWIRAAIKTQLRILLALSLSCILMAVMCNKIVSIWVPKQPPFELPLVAGFLALTNVMLWNNLFGTFLGGIGKITLSVFHAALSAILSIPLAFLFAKTLDMGLVGVILGVAVALATSSVTFPMQVYKITSAQPAGGIWAK